MQKLALTFLFLSYSSLTFAAIIQQQNVAQVGIYQQTEATTMEPLNSGSKVVKDGNGQVVGLLVQKKSSDNEFALITQHGTANFAEISQSGEYEDALLEQLGDDNTAYISQAGDHNTAIVTQHGNSNEAYIVQLGGGNSANISQSGNNAIATIYQNGSGNSATINQH